MAKKILTVEPKEWTSLIEGLSTQSFNEWTDTE